MRRVARWLSPAGSLRAVLLVASLVLMFLTHTSVARVVWLIVIGGQAVVAEVAARTAPGRTREGRLLLWLLVGLEAITTSVAAIRTGPADSPLLPLLVAAPVDAALCFGPAGLLTVLGLQVATLTITGAAQSVPIHSTASASIQWVLLGIAFGGVCLLLPRSIDEEPDELRWQLAQSLIDELGAVARELPTLDPAAAADELLADCKAQVPVRSGAVLRSTADDRLVPLALTGTSRIPWTHPLANEGPMRQAWTTGEPYVERRAADEDPTGRRRDSTLLVVPLSGKAGVLGLLVLDAADLSTYDAAQVELVRQAADRAAPRLEAGLAFDELRQAALMEERNRLAREMHDGVAQEVAAIGFEVDLLRRWVAQAAPDGLAKVEHLRDLVDSISSGVRVAMIDLRAGVSPDRGLSSALTSYLQSVAQATGMRVHVELADSGFRLPGAYEESLYRLVHECVTALRNQGSSELRVTLEIDPPSAHLCLEASSAPWMADPLRKWLQEHADDQGYDLVFDHRLEVIVRTGERMTP